MQCPKLVLRWTSLLLAALIISGTVATDPAAAQSDAKSKKTTTKKKSKQDSAKKESPELQQINALEKEGDSLREKGDYAAAAFRHQKALELAEKFLGADSLKVASLLNDLGRDQQNKGDYAKAEPLYKRSLEIRVAKLGKNQPAVATTLNNLAVLYRSMGQYAKAEPLYKRSLQIYQAKLGKDHPDVALSLSNLANLYEHMGQYARAESLNKRSLEIREAKLGKDHPDVALSLNNLASLYKSMGHYDTAEPLYKRSLVIWEAKLGKDHPNVALSLNNLANLYEGMGQYARAEPLFRRSLEIREAKLGKDHPSVATSLNNLADLYDSMGQYAKAVPLHKRSLEIKEAKLGKDHPSVATSLSNLASLYSSMGQNAKAEPLYKRSLEIWEAKLGKDHPDVALSLNNVALFYKSMGQYDKAEPLYKRSLEIWEAKLGKDHPDVALSLNNLASLYGGMGQPDKAFLVADRARRLLRGHIATVLPVLSETEQKTFLKKKIESAYHLALSLGFSERGSGDSATRSASWLLNGKAVVEEVLAGAVLLQRDSSDAATAEFAKELVEVRRQLARLSSAPPRPDEDSERLQNLAKLSAREQELSRRLRQAGGRAVTARWAEQDELRKKLPAGAAFIDIARFDVFDFKAAKGKRWRPARYVAWITLASGDVKVVDLGPAKDIDEAATLVRIALAKGPQAIKAQGEATAEKALQNALQTLGKLVLDPLLPHVGEATRLYVSPDASLWLTPWAALPLPDGKYAVEKYSIRLLVSGRDLVNEPAKPTGKVQTPVLIGDPDYDLGQREAVQTGRAILRGRENGEATRAPSEGLRLGNVRRLRFSESEVAAAATKLQDWLGVKPRLFTGKRALEGVFKAVRSPKVLLLSTHGFFLPDQQTYPAKLDRLGEKTGPALTKEGKPWENPLLRCGLLLAGCNNPPKDGESGDDGVLTGLEIVGTDLRGTELVVLSACETGLGEVRNGEGVAGLRQAFQLAGAEAVVATLWQIPDRQSAQLMIRFFDELAAGKDKAVALAEAQRAMIKERREKTGAAHPFFWAAYTLTGR